jgi:hypothetical protein
MESANAANHWERLEGHLDAALAELTDEQRHVLVLRHFPGLTLSEVAIQLGCGKDRAAERVAEAQKALAKALGRRGPALSSDEVALLLEQRAVQAAPPTLVTATANRLALIRAAAVAAGISRRVTTRAKTPSTGAFMRMLWVTVAAILATFVVVFIVSPSRLWSLRSIGSGSDSVPLSAVHGIEAPSAVTSFPAPRETAISLDVGSIVPDVSAPSVSGASVNLAVLRGKYVLINFWAGYNNQRMELAVKLKDVFDRFRDDRRFAMIGFDLDDRPETVRSWVAREAIGWEQGMLDTSKSDLALAYQEPADPILIIGPDGKVIARSREVFEPYRTLERLLGSKLGPPLQPPIRVVVEHNDPPSASATYKFRTLPPPQPTEADQGAQIEMVDADLNLDRNSLALLTDGRGADNDNDPSHAIYARRWRLQDRFRMDLHRVMPIAQINTYSWHRGERCPQVYRVYGSAGEGTAFNLQPQNGLDPRSCGWTLIASVDTRPTSGPMGGQDAVSVQSSTGCIGHFRHLLFQVFPTNLRDGFGNTFYNEIDVVECK